MEEDLRDMVVRPTSISAVRYPTLAPNSWSASLPIELPRVRAATSIQSATLLARLEGATSSATFKRRQQGVCRSASLVDGIDNLLVIRVFAEVDEGRIERVFPCPQALKKTLSGVRLSVLCLLHGGIEGMAFSQGSKTCFRCHDITEFADLTRLANRWLSLSVAVYPRQQLA